MRRYSGVPTLRTSNISITKCETLRHLVFYNNINIIECRSAQAYVIVRNQCVFFNGTDNTQLPSALYRQPKVKSYKCLFLSPVYTMKKFSAEMTLLDISVKIYIIQWVHSKNQYHISLHSHHNNIINEAWLK